MAKHEEPDINVPEGIFLPEAVRQLGNDLFENGGKNTEQQHAECTRLICEWVLTEKVTSFTIGSMSKSKASSPDFIFRDFSRACRQLSHT